MIKINKAKLKNINNINLISLCIIIFLVLIILIAIYFINNLLPKKYNIPNNINILETKSSFEVNNIEKGKIFSKIYIKKKLSDEELKDFTNYVSGQGKNFYFNYQIILENNKKNYKVKTIIKDSNEAIFFDKINSSDNSIIIEGIFLNKNFFKENYNISIIQKDYINNNPDNKIVNYYKDIGKIGG